MSDLVDLEIYRSAVFPHFNASLHALCRNTHLDSGSLAHTLVTSNRFGGRFFGGRMGGGGKWKQTLTCSSRCNMQPYEHLWDEVLSFFPTPDERLVSLERRSVTVISASPGLVNMQPGDSTQKSYPL
ncbi:hypothetical protein PROFUN_13010 [Planoprotostelium fungivorum]|uniref:Uncharacterized protein n=1 Tax=Planoprotostelium fungivorum TaxID=1890364 RepID=A0A2P6N5T4_9EUKA|nr:hypothetical protein PROFUN_13010 [Planoprotostelium fungivorum]